VHVRVELTGLAGCPGLYLSKLAYSLSNLLQQSVQVQHVCQQQVLQRQAHARHTSQGRLQKATEPLYVPCAPADH
jgi:hypothetical protein